MNPTQVLKRANKAKGWDDKGTQLSKASGVHITMVRRYLGIYGDEPPKIQPPNALRLAEALGIAPDDLLYGTKTKAA